MVTCSNRPKAWTAKSVTKGNCPTFMGLSTDEKPTNTGENSLFWELDTGKLYYYANSTWTEYTGDASVGIEMI